MRTPPLSSIAPLLKTRWQLMLAIFSVMAISLSLLLHALSSPNYDKPLLLLVFIATPPFILQMILKLVRGNFGADTLAVIAMITGIYLQSFLAVSIILLMLASGQTLEYYAKQKASSVLQALIQRMPATAHRKVNGLIEEVLLTDIKINDEIMIYPHETCPVDGVVLEGNGTMDESYLTGEPYLISKAPGGVVLSGAINGEAALVIKATKLAVDSRYSLIVNVLREAEEKRPSIRRLGDKIGAIFSPIALLFALLTWYLTGDMTRFLAVLVIATPCPLLIAIPITIISAISRAAKESIIIKDPVVLEQLPRCRTAIFDKTGTLTYGKPILTAIYTAPGFTEEEILQYAGSLERYSKHPLASAVLAATQERHIPLIDATEVSEKPGQGLFGRLHHNAVTITNRKQCLAIAPDSKGLLPPVATGLECVILIHYKYAGTFHFHDAPRVESKTFISHLAPTHQFKKIMLVSGDREAEVYYLAQSLPFTQVYAAQSPEQKLAIVRLEREQAPTVFMGDGINDAPALTAATVGIAFGQNSSITAEAAGAVIMDSALNKVDVLLHLSNKTRMIAAQSAAGGMVLSLIGMGLAAAGYIQPVTGAVIQECIDVLAIANALRLAFGTTIETDVQPSTDPV